MLVAPLLPVAVSVTVCIIAVVPVLVNECVTGLPLTTAVPSPKFQDTLVAFDEVLEKVTENGAVPLFALAVRLATGFCVGGITMEPVVESTKV